MGLKLILDTKDAVRAADEFAKAVDRVRKAVGVAGTEADKFQKKTDGMSRRFGSAGKSAEAAAAKVEKFNAALRNTPAQAQKVTVAVQRMGNASASSSGQIQSLVRQFLGIAAARKAVTTIAELESGLVTLGTVTGRTGRDLEELRDTAVAVARETRFTPEETVGALLSLSRAGQDAATAAESLISVTQLAQAGVTSLGQAADLTAATIAQFSSQGVDAAKAASTLVATADRTKSTVLSLGASLAQAGQAAATFGVSLSETAAVAGVLQDSGVQASRAGRAIKTILAQLASAGERSEASRESLRKLGLQVGQVIPGQFNEATGAAQTFTDVLRSLRQGLASVGGEERTNILRNLVGKDFFAVLSAAIDGIEKIDRVAAASADSIGELTEKADRQNQTLSASLRGVGSAFQEVLIDVGNTKDGLKDTVDAFADAIRILGGARGAFRDVADGAQAMALAIKAVGFLALAQGARIATVALLSASNPIGLIATGLAGLALAANEAGKALAGVDDVETSKLQDFNQLSNTLDNNAEKALRLQRELAKAVDTLDSDEAEQKLTQITSSVTSALRTVSNTSGEFTTSLASALGVLREVDRLSITDIGLEEAVKPLATGALEVTRLASLVNRFEAVAQRGVKGQLRAGDRQELENYARTIQSLTGETIDSEKLYSQQIKKANKVLEDRIKLLGQAASDQRRAFNELKQQQALDKEDSKPTVQIDSTEANTLKGRLATAREERDVREASLRLKESILVQDGKSVQLEKDLQQQIVERLKLEVGFQQGDNEALKAAKSLAVIEAERTRKKAEALLKTQQDNEAKKVARQAEADAERARKKALQEEAKLREKLAEQEERLILSQLAAAGDKEGVKLLEAEIDAGSLTGLERALFIAKELQIAENEKLEKARETVREARKSVELSENELRLTELQGQIKAAIADGTLEESGLQGTLVDRLTEKMMLEEGIKAENVDIVNLLREAAKLEAEILVTKKKQSKEAADIRKAASEQRQADRAIARLERGNQRIRARFGGQTLEERKSIARESVRQDPSIPEGRREEAFAKSDERVELENKLENFNAIQSSIEGALSTLAQTFISGDGDIRSALGNIAQALATDLINQAITRLAGSITSSLFADVASSTSKATADATEAAAQQALIGSTAMASGSMIAFAAAAQTASLQIAAAGATSSFGGIAQKGRVIPAQTGRIMNSPTNLTRGGKTYSVAEGGGSTPEAVMPLMRDSQGRLGVAGGGGGSTNITMNFPNVQTTQEARAMRSTMRQQVTGILGSQGQSRGARNKK